MRVLLIVLPGVSSDGGGGIAAIGVVVFLFITAQLWLAFWAWLWREHHKAVLRHRAREAVRRKERARQRALARDLR